MSKPYIYKTINLINNKIYIGKSNGNRKNYKGSGKLIKQAFKKYGRENFKKELIVEGNFNNNLLNELEIHYIRLYNSTNLKIGYNLENGGAGFNKSSQITLKIKRKEINKKISESKKGIKFSKSHIENIKKAKLGVQYKSRWVKIKQLNKFTNEIIKIWENSISIEKELGISTSNIIACCKGRKNSTNGFKWTYVD